MSGVVESKKDECPYDFLLDFDNWFLWHTFVHFYNLKPEHATLNVRFQIAGWTLCNGFKHGCWQKSRFCNE